MALTISGTIENADLKGLHINRRSNGTLSATVIFSIGGIFSETATWELSEAEKTTIVSLLPGAKQAIADRLTQLGISL